MRNIAPDVPYRQTTDYLIRMRMRINGSTYDIDEDMESCGEVEDIGVVRNEHRCSVRGGEGEYRPEHHHGKSCTTLNCPVDWLPNGKST